MVITRMMADRGQPSQSPTPTENIFDYLPRTQNGKNSSGNVGGRSSWSFYNSTFYWKEHFKRFNNQAHIRDNDMQKQTALDTTQIYYDYLSPRHCSLSISCSWRACPLWRVARHKRLVLSVQLNTTVVTLSRCSSLTKDTHDLVSFVVGK